MRKVLGNKSFIWLMLTLLTLLAACSSARHVPKGQYLLDKVNLEIVDSAASPGLPGLVYFKGSENADGSIRRSDMMNYLRQQPNHKMLWSWKLQLGVYNLSGKDSTKWWNRWIRKLGEPPVVYDSLLTAAGVEQLRKAMVNKGFLAAEVEADTVRNDRKRKMTVNYTLRPGKPHIVKSIDYQFADSTLRDIVLADSAHFTIREGDPLDRSLLENQREVITSYLRNRGYFAFGKEYITFNADTTAGSFDTDLTMTVNLPKQNANLPADSLHHKYMIGRIVCIEDYDPVTMEDITRARTQDTISYRGLTILCSKHPYLQPKVIYDNCWLKTGEVYNARNVERTYRAFSRLSILKFINVHFEPAGKLGDTEILDTYILLTKGKSQTISAELEGTNSAGDLGVAAALTYSHRNIGRGSETLSVKARGAYESLSGNLDGLIHNRYMEYSLDAGVNFPKFTAPFLSENFKRRVQATTELNVSLNYQERPEYTRIIGTAGWSYKWAQRNNRNRHTFTPLDINYVYLPESTNNFINQIAPDNPLLRYSYEDHFIMRMGYSFYHTNKRLEHLWTRGLQQNVYTVRVNTELAGNILFIINTLFTRRHNFRDDPYKVFGIRYSQYFKVDADYAFNHYFNRRNSLAFHAGVGVGVPYGNSYALPFEKRFYGGGANGVRGWDVRTLGPGSFNGSNKVTDFINQCGDIRLDLSAEYRAKLFWVIELGLFVDAGNIWTIRDYPTQPGGVFRFDKFYKQIAAAYGIGLRLDFNYFLLRFDLGMKAHNPADGQEPWPIIHPRWHRDSSFHFSIGYPF